jgi:hypothetical protein
MPTKEEIQTLAHKLSKRLSDQGRLIEAGWILLRAMAVPPDAPEVQVNEMRYAFMAGAQHLFGSIMSTLDPGEEPTNADLRRLDLIHNELEAFRKEMELRHGRAHGSA